MLYQILREMHLDASTVPTEVSDDVKIAIIEALKFNRHDRYGFNEATYNIGINSNQNSYLLPPDFLGLVGDVYYTPENSSSWRFPLRKNSLDAVEFYKFVGNDYNNWPNSGIPFQYAIDISNNSILLNPIPTSDNAVIDFRYVKDIGTPIYTNNGSGTWTFYLPDGITILPGTFSNKWFTEAPELIKSRAMYYLHSRTYDGSEATQAKTQAYLMQWTEEKLRLSTLTGNKQSITEPRKWF